ncbi:hypothetical protein ABZ682_15905 [Streptomyces griseoviridis]|uniref:hypothetical protein n=1 Tax=Streptomyces griseoviridis TaxID=45398 RepID=UPI003402258A
MTPWSDPRPRRPDPECRECRDCRGLALDLGSARTRVWISGQRSILDVPTASSPGDGPVGPVRRGRLVDVAGAARMLRRTLGDRVPPLDRPLVVVTVPVLSGPPHRERVRTALDVLRPRAVVPVTAARAVALAADADLSRPLLVVDLGALLTEVVLLVKGTVFDARRAESGLADLSTARDPGDLTDAVVTMIASMFRQARGPLCADALARGVLVAGGGALRPELISRLAGGLRGPVRTVPAPHTAAIRGAAMILHAAHTHPSTRADRRTAPRPA